MMKHAALTPIPTTASSIHKRSSKRAAAERSSIFEIYGPACRQERDCIRARYCRVEESGHRDGLIQEVPILHEQMQFFMYYCCIFFYTEQTEESMQGFEGHCLIAPLVVNGSDASISIPLRTASVYRQIRNEKDLETFTHNSTSLMRCLTFVGVWGWRMSQRTSKANLRSDTQAHTHHTHNGASAERDREIPQLTSQWPRPGPRARSRYYKQRSACWRLCRDSFGRVACTTRTRRALSIIPMNLPDTATSIRNATAPAGQRGCAGRQLTDVVYGHATMQRLYAIFVAM